MGMAVPAHARETMRIVYSEQFQPFSWNESGVIKGILVDVLDEALSRRMGLEVVHEGYPWERAQEMVKHGQADAFATIATPQRLEYARASAHPLVTITFTLFTGADNPNLDRLRAARGLDDLKDFTFGANSGSGWSQKNLAGYQVKWLPKRENVLKMLVVNRVDAFIDVSQSVRFNLKKLGLTDSIVELPHVYEQSDFKLFIGNKSSLQRILPAFDAVMEEMQRDGTLQRIYETYQ
jgi:polar amino acid transport system substrate-binding protein